MSEYALVALILFVCAGGGGLFSVGYMIGYDRGYSKGWRDAFTANEWIDRRYG